MSIYLDCNATTPIEEEVLGTVVKYMREEFGNSGSRTHEYGRRAKQAVETARRAISRLVDARPEEVIFTSGATESNNLAILGLIKEGARSGRKHIVSTNIEHKAVLEPLEIARDQFGCSITLIPASLEGAVDATDVVSAVRPDTLLVTVMHVNNETGVVQPITKIADQLANRSPYLHVDAAQGFGKLISDLKHPRIDLISASSHKIYGPKGVGALISRSVRGVNRAISPLMFGGGQERGLRPGTLPVPLIAGFGKAADLAANGWQHRYDRCAEIRNAAVLAFKRIGAQFNGDQRSVIPTTLNVSIPGVDSEAAFLILKDLVAISNGSACTSTSYKSSHVLEAMRLPPERIASALRLSWSHLTPDPHWDFICQQLERARV